MIGLQIPKLKLEKTLGLKLVWILKLHLTKRSHWMERSMVPEILGPSLAWSYRLKPVFH